MEKKPEIRWVVKKRKKLFSLPFVILDTTVITVGLISFYKGNWTLSSLLALFLIVYSASYFSSRYKARKGVEVVLSEDGMIINQANYEWKDFERFSFFPENKNPYFVLFFRTKIRPSLDIDLPRQEAKAERIRRFLKVFLEEEEREESLAQIIFRYFGI